MKKVLVTYFEKFSNHEFNSTQILPSLKMNIDNVDFIELPVEYSRAQDKLEEYLKRDYSLVLLFGMAANREKITIERIALNLQHSKIADNLGHIANNEVVVADGPLALETNLDIDGIIQKSSLDSSQLSYSLSAGSYVCNAVFYRGLHIVKKYFPETKLGFIHIPKKNDPEKLQNFLRDTIQVSLGETN